jgi:hypothetical protein
MPLSRRRNIWSPIHEVSDETLLDEQDKKIKFKAEKKRSR